jgi:hypothetical protein
MEPSIPYHIPTAFKVGDRVMAVKDIQEAHAWYAYLVEPNARSKGVMIVRDIDEVLGFLCVLRQGGEIGWYPSPALELAAEQAVVIDVPFVDSALLEQLSVASTGRKRK